MPPKPTPKPTEPIEPFVPNEDRRIAPRLKPHEVPWIREVKPISGDTARLLNISKTGLLLETTARLQPGRRSTVVIAVDGSERKERAEGHVIRTELVSIGAGGELIYRTAMAFTDELNLRLPDAPAEAERTDSHTAANSENDGQVEGPLPGLWATTEGSQQVSVSHISQGTCYVKTSRPPAKDEWASVTVFFSPVRSLTLTGKVAAVEEHGGCLLRFESLSSDVRRALRVEIREWLAEQGPKAVAPTLSIGLVTESAEQGDVVVEWHSPANSLYANQW